MIFVLVLEIRPTEVGLQRGVQIRSSEDEAETRSSGDLVSVSQLVQDSVSEAWIQRGDTRTIQLSRVGLAIGDMGVSGVGPFGLLSTSFAFGPSCGGASGAGPGGGVVIFCSLFDDGIVNIFKSAFVEGVCLNKGGPGSGSVYGAE